MGRTKLSLVAELTPEQQAEREFTRLASGFTESPEMQLLKNIFICIIAMQEEMKALKVQPRHDPDELVDAKYVAKRLGLSRGKAGALIHIIGAVRVGEKNGALRCWLRDLDRYLADTGNYQQHDRRAA